MTSELALLEALPAAVYATDAEGRITFFNEAAVTLWGCRPEIGQSQWCGSWRLYWPDGRPMAHDECPMAVTLKERRAVRGVDAVLERPDGTRVPFIPYPELMTDESGRVVGAVNLLVDISDRKTTEIDLARLAAIVSSSDDAIVSKTLDGTVTSWNAGATRIFGYEAEEMIGQSIMRIIPPELQEEEADILNRIRRGERIDHFDTVRVAKDGRHLDISLTVSPLVDRAGIIVGASKVARDVTERKESEKLQRLLYDELNHRIKNTLTTIQAIASQSLRRSANPRDFVASFNGRVQALARAHDILIQGNMRGAELSDIVREQVLLGAPDGHRISCSGPSLQLNPRVAVQLALILHELATNARKYGALANPEGQLSITWKVDMRNDSKLILEWRESGVRNVKTPSSHGFGTILIERTVKANGGDVVIHYGGDGVVCEISLPLPENDEYQSRGVRSLPVETDRFEAFETENRQSLEGKRILIIEDEALVAMETESQLISFGCEVVGPAGTVSSALDHIAAERIDAALVDANLAGHTVQELAAALTQKDVPFIFATGYGREALPLGFQEAPILTKPFGPERLRATLESLLRPSARSSGVVALRKER